MQETRNNCFGSKIRRTILHQAKTGKYECRMLLLYFAICAYLFLSVERSCYVFSTRNNCYECLASYGVIIQSVIHSWLGYKLTWVIYCIDPSIVISNIIDGLLTICDSHIKLVPFLTRVLLASKQHCEFRKIRFYLISQ